MPLVPGVRPTLEVAGRTFTDLLNLIILKYYVTTSGSRSTGRKPSSTTGYQVTSGKTLKQYAWALAQNNTGSNSLMIAYNDADIGFATSTAFTNPVYESGDINAVWNVAASQFTFVSFPTDFGVVAQKYSSVQGSGGANAGSIIYSYGHEV